MNMNMNPLSNLEFVREDDFVEYFLFPEIPENLYKKCTNDEETRFKGIEKFLGNILEQCMDLVKKQVDERFYIWHKDEFQLRIRTGSAKEHLLNEELKEKDGILPPHLHGVTHYGDNINDEWFIVYLLHILTEHVPKLIARVIDSDGEFLLIEAADFLPKWANPETCEQRVYLCNGEILLVQDSTTNIQKLLPVDAAISKIRVDSSPYKVCTEITKIIQERLKEFQSPESCKSQLHRQIVRLPQGVAGVLKQKPSLIAAAVRAFHERDQIDMRACRTMRFFPPEQRIRTNICFTRCLYAMIMSTKYVPDKKIGWNLSLDTNSEQYKEDLLGVKIACGFEILASLAKDSNNIENEPAWKAYVRSLTAKGYFKDNIEGSQDYKKLLEDAKAFYNSNNERFRTAPFVGRDILDLLHNSDVNLEQLRDEENNLQPSDSDDWLNISAEDLDAMLIKRYGPQKLYQANGDINAAEFTKQLSDFLEKQSTFEGIDSDDTENEDMDDTEVETNIPVKSKVRKNPSMRKACQDPINLKSKNSTTASASASNAFSANSMQENDTTHVRNFLDFNIPEDNWESTSEMSDYEDEDDLEKNFEAMSNSENQHIDAEIQAYMAQMDRELSKTTVGKSFTSSSNKPKLDSDDDEFDDIENFKPIDINVNTLKNMMDSYKSQMGGSGPVSNLFNAMGIGLAQSNKKDDQSNDLTESAV